MNNDQSFSYSPSCSKQAQAVPGRVPKACDRCRLKKAKCDGKKPCSRCESEDTVCSFATSKKFRNVMHPKGSVEMLLQQQEWLVSGLLELYRRTQLSCTSTKELDGKSGVPSVHHILEQLGVLEESQQNCVVADPAIEASRRQQRLGAEYGDSHDISPSSKVGSSDSQFKPQEDMQRRLSRQTSTSGASSEIYLPTNSDPYAAMLEFQNAPPKTELILPSQPAPVGYSTCYNFVTGFDDPVSAVSMASHTQTPFTMCLPQEHYNDKGSLCSADSFQQQIRRSPFQQMRPGYEHMNLTQQSFRASTVPSVHSQGRA